MLLFEQDFADGARTRVTLTGERAARARAALKAVPGGVLRVGLLNGAMGTGTVLSISGETLSMNVTLDRPPPEPLPVTLILALPRPKVLKRCVEAVTALGVKKIFLIQSYRVEKSYWSSPALSADVLREHALIGLEQARDTALPSIEIRKRFKPFVEDEVPAIVKGARALVAHPGAGKKCPCNSATPVTLAVGPEGGFIPYEIGLFESQGFEAVSLGERILRVEHAVPALLGRLSRT